HPPGDVGTGEAVPGQKGVDVVADVPAYEVGHLGAEDDAQTTRPDVPAHGLLGVGVETTAPVHDPRVCHAVGDDTRGLAVLVSDGDDRGGPVPEQPAGHEIGHGAIAALHGQ